MFPSEHIEIGYRNRLGILGETELAPVYLIKRELDGVPTFHVMGPGVRDMAHWALEIRGKHYHIDANDEGHIEMVPRNIPEQLLLAWAPRPGGFDKRHIVGFTNKSRDEIERICQEIVSGFDKKNDNSSKPDEGNTNSHKLGKRRYRALKRNCQELVNDFWNQIVEDDHSTLKSGENLLSNSPMSSALDRFWRSISINCFLCGFRG